MIELFMDFGSDYWLKNKVIDCGKSDYSKNIELDIDIQENINDDDIYYDNICKKLNNKHKQRKYKYNNESECNNRNSKSTTGNTRTEQIYISNSKNKYNRYKNNDNRITNSQKTGEYISVHKYTSINNNQRQMYNMRQKS
jgi:hypothetical protein